MLLNTLETICFRKPSESEEVEDMVGAQVKALKHIFDLFDEDGDGEVSFAELGRRLEDRAGRQWAGRLWSAYENRDGQISFWELLAAEFPSYGDAERESMFNLVHPDEPIMLRSSSSSSQIVLRAASFEGA